MSMCMYNWKKQNYNEMHKNVILIVNINLGLVNSALK